MPTPASSESQAASTTTDDLIRIVFSGIDDESSSIIVPNTQKTSSSNSNMFRLVLLLSALAGVVIMISLVWIVYKRLGKRKIETSELPLDPAEMNVISTIPMTSVTSTLSNMTETTLMTTSYGLSVPGYLRQEYEDLKPIKEIASGGFGEIYLGEIQDMKGFETGMKVVMKTLRTSDKRFSKKQLDMFYQEVAIMELLKSHRNIAKIYAYTENPHSIVMKYCSGGSLHMWIYDKSKKSSKGKIFGFLKDVASGLEFMNLKGLVHADLKPRNILIDEDQQTGKEFCVLTDFGITQIVSGKSLLVEAFHPINVNAASVTYAAPEEIMKLRKGVWIANVHIPKLDVYSFSIVLWEITNRLGPYSIN